MGRLNPKLTAQQIKQKRKQKKIRKKQTKLETELKRSQIKNKLASHNNEQNAVVLQMVDVIKESQNILTGKYYDYFKGVFEKNQARAMRYYQLEDKQTNQQKKQQNAQGNTIENANKEVKYSRKQRKKMIWLRVADLKAKVKRPDLVQAWDITAPHPTFLCQLKTLKNTIPVPRHWNQKSKFLQTKRGILKPMFKLPEFIEATGISKLRDPFSERDGQKMVKQKLKERMNPKLGKIDIDYAVLHDAFFKYQLKSDLTVFGQVYYEGKQDESKARQFKPGLMSQSLRIALNISDYQAPPWIINMQRFGAPPSYPTLRILGSNIPFSQLSSYEVINKTNLEEAARKLGQPGLYATFRSYEEKDQEQYIDKGYWGQITNLDEIVDQEPEEGWEEDNDAL